MPVETIAPVRKTVTVEVPRQRAFDVFTQKIGTWWKPGYSIGAAPFVDVLLEPREGGRWYEVDAEGNECPWGRVMVWEPPTRVVLAWQITDRFAYDPGLETEVEVRFVEEGPTTTRVDLEHRNLDRYGGAAAPMREAFDGPDGWLGLLELFSRAAATA